MEDGVTKRRGKGKGRGKAAAAADDDDDEEEAGLGEQHARERAVRALLLGRDIG